MAIEDLSTGRPPRWRVVHLIPTLAVGGAERQVLNLAAASAGSDVDAQIAVFGSDADRSGMTRFAEPPAVTRLPFRWRSLAWKWPRVVQSIRALRPDIIHAHMGTVVAGAPLGRLAGARAVVWTQHGSIENSFAAFRAGFPVARFCVDRAVGVSLDISDRIIAELGVKKSRVSTVPNGVPIPSHEETARSRARVREELGLGPESRLAAFVGRVSPEKNVARIVEVFVRIAGDRPDWHLLVVGDGPSMADARCAASESGPAIERVRFLGTVDDAPSIMSAIDVLTLFSSSEGLPMAALEAMAAGRPVVASAVGALPDLLGGGGGLLVEPGDEAALANALAALLGDPAASDRVGALARKTAEDRYSIDLSFRRYRSLYLSALGVAPGEATSRQVSGGR